MQLFILDEMPDLAAALLCDKHLTSQAKETCQILYTVLHWLDLVPADDPAYPNLKPLAAVWAHPCVYWASSCATAFLWTVHHGAAICAEFERRYGHAHAYVPHFERLAVHFDDVRDLFPRKPAGPFSWLDTLSDKGQESVEPRLAMTDLPTNVPFAVCAMDPEHIVDGDDGFPSCVQSYRKFYTHKAKKMFVMKWGRELTPPPAISAAFAQHYPESAPLQVSAKKRKREVVDEDE